MKIFIIPLVLLVATMSPAQTRLGLHECEERFIHQNLQAIAAHYNVDIAEAQASQAGLWDNPQLSAEMNAIDPEQKQLFNVGGEKSFSIEQLLHLGGQKSYEHSVAEATAESARYQFDDVLRNLKFQLHQAFFSLYYDNNSLEALDTQLSNISELTQKYIEQQAKGTVSLKDVTRLQALAISFRNSRTEVIERVNDEEKTLEVLLRLDSGIVPVPTTTELQRYQEALNKPLDSLIRVAIDNRPDLKATEETIEASKWNCKWQRSLAIPDLTVGATYDQRGSAYENEINLSLSIPLPLWNRNQGNIAAADATLRQATTTQELGRLQVIEEVKFAYKRYQQARENFLLADSTLTSNFQTIYRSMLENFQNRNTSMIEFTDFMESYHQSIVEINQLRNTFIQACEQLNLSTNSSLF
ncbi:MAG TPA: TolC family protein [Candidatus Kapabacteria bacterium]|nr:TolC family protein [Candidatus Kapabacteria bacterium]